MGSSFFGLSTAVSGLFANKKALDTVGHNVSNMNTKGYTRQQVNHSTNLYEDVPAGRVGTGVQIQEIRQIRDRFLDMRYREQNRQSAYYDARTEVFEQVEEIFNDLDDSGIQKVVSEFWNKWDEVAKNPEDLTNRALLKQSSQAMIDTVNHISDQLDDLQRNLNKNIEQMVGRINEIADEIAHINKEIIHNEGVFGGANDLRDRRNVLIDELSGLLPIDTLERSDGSINITVGGKHLVQSIFTTKMMTIPRKSSYVDVYWDEFESIFDNELVDLDVSTEKAGALRGLIDARGDVDSRIVGKGNGAVNLDVDVHFVSNSGTLNANQNSKLSEFKNSMKSELEDYELNPEISEDNAKTFSNIYDLIDYVDAGGNFENKDGHQKIILMTNSTIDISGSATMRADLLSELKDRGVSISIIGDINDKNLADITEATGGTLHDITKIDEPNYLKDLAFETNSTASEEMGDVGEFAEVIPDIKQKLNAFINGLVRNINRIHEKGYDLEGNKGEPLFVRENPALPLQAGNIKLNPIFDEEKGLNYFAAADKPEERGNGKIAEKINKLREKRLFGSKTPDNYYRSITSELAVSANHSKGMKDNFDTLKNEVENKRQQISGVSMDEEMTLMMKYQYAFSANSRMINVIDQMIDKLINGTGRVGI